MRTQIGKVAILMATASAFSLNTYAQETEPITESNDEARTLEVVIVEAQRREENIQDVPIAINAFNAEDVALRGINGIDDLTLQVPGLTFGDIAGVGQINLRGVGFGVISGNGENSVAVHYDGVYIPNPGASNLLQSDIGSVEVLRGPQGTLFGRNATGGLVNFNSAAPTDELTGGARVGYGNFDAISASGEISGPITDNIRARASVDFLDRDGYIDNLATGGDEGDLNRIGLKLGIEADVTQRLEAKLNVFAVEEQSGTPYYDPIDELVFSGGISPDDVALDPFEIRTNTDSDGNKGLFGGGLRLSYDLTDNIEIVSLTGYVDFTFDSLYDGDGTSASVFDTVDRVVEDRAISQEVLIVGTTDRVDWTLGGYYLNQDIDIDSFTSLEGLAPFVGTGSVLNVTQEDVDSFALFADTTIALNETFSVYGGVRYINEDRSVLQSQTLGLDSGTLSFGAFAAAAAVDPFTNPVDFGLDPAAVGAVFAAIAGGADPTTNPAVLQPVFTGVFVPVPVCADLDLSFSDDAVTGRAGIKADFGDVNTYAQYSRGYKSGGFASSSCNDPFEPETLDAFEIGTKTVLFGNTSLNAAFFYYDYTDLQVESVEAPNIFVNNADAEIFGLEAEIFSQLTDQLSVNFGFTWLDAEFTEFFNVDALNPLAGLQDLSGNPLLRSPDYQFTAGIQYEHPLTNELNLIFRGDLTATDDFQLREFNVDADAQDAYVTANLSVNLIYNEKYTLRGWVKNIADEAILGGVFNAGALGPARVGSFALPRTFGFEIGVEF